MKIEDTYDINNAALQMSLRYGLDALVKTCHGASKRAGWWADPHVGDDYLPEIEGGTRLGVALVNEKLALIHSEISEAMEGYRKDAMDDKLPGRPQVEVELADAIIRICDLAGALQVDLAGALVEKMLFNAHRADHKPENRRAAGGKRF